MTDYYTVVTRIQTAATILLVVAVAAIVALGWAVIELRETRKDVRALERLARWRGNALAAMNDREKAAREEAARLRAKVTPTTREPYKAPRAPTLVKL